MSATTIAVAVAAEMVGRTALPAFAVIIVIGPAADRRPWHYKVDILAFQLLLRLFPA